MDKFSDKLKELRIENNLTQKDVAKMVGISITCYAGYEQGYREPDLKTLKKICLVLNTSADFLLGLEEESNTSKIYFNIQNNYNK